MFNRLISRIIFAVLIITILSAVPMNVSAATNQEITDMRNMKSKIVAFCISKDIMNDGTNARVQWCYKSQAGTYLSTQNVNGSWADVNYADTGSAANGAPWLPYLALDRMQAMAQAFADPANQYYHSPSMQNGIQKAIDYWFTVNPTSVNWWENGIGRQERLMKIAVMCEGYLTSTEVTNIVNILSAAQTTDGTNSSWYTQECGYKGLILEDPNTVRSAIAAFNVLANITITVTGIQTDMGFFEHGKKNYTTGYGMSFARDMAFWAYLTTGTVFAFDPNAIVCLSSYILDGTRWILKGNVADLGMGMNGPNWPGYTSSANRFYEDPLKWMQTANPVRAGDFSKALTNIQGGSTDNGLKGNRTLWDTLVSSHMRTNYGITVKMASSTVTGGEWRTMNPNGYNLLYWTCQGATAIQQHGDEYEGIYPLMDWAHVPGTTAPDALTKDGGFTNPKTFVGGVTNEKYGATAFDFNKLNTSGKKGYFFFDNEMVALGAGITSTATAPIHTTLNQCLARGSVLVDGNLFSGNAISFTGKWVYHDGIGYVFPDTTTYSVQNKSITGSWSNVIRDSDTTSITQNVFSLWLNHGTNPTNASYQYIVLPGETSAQVSSYANSLPVSIISNTASIQGVRHNTLGIAEILFYQAGRVTVRSGLDVTVDQPCMVIIDESASPVKISVANPETSGITVNVTLNRNGTQTTTKFTLGTATFTGRSITQPEGGTIDDSGYALAYYKPVVASSSHGNSLAASNGVDCLRASRWGSNYTDNEWIYVDLTSQYVINKVILSWETAYGRSYKIQVSNDAANWTDVYSTTTGDGGTDVINFTPTSARYVKMLGIQRGTGYGYSLWDFEVYEAPGLAQNKAATASSSKDSTVAASYAVDGNMSTRWGSNYTDNEWIHVDLGSTQSINQVVLNWETAYGKSYKIQVSNDAINWTDVYSTTTGDGGTDIIGFTETTARYVKMLGIQRGTGYGYSLWEFKVY